MLSLEKVALSGVSPVWLLRILICYGPEWAGVHVHKAGLALANNQWLSSEKFV